MAGALVFGRRAGVNRRLAVADPRRVGIGEIDVDDGVGRRTGIGAVVVEVNIAGEFHGVVAGFVY